ncbi:hypothetical protein LPJ70_004499 [Coemansia sp. RSA 2708]|nr:hypothetical protein LPJ70_004499 [Coemansia sp. RSA 2708]
MSTERALTYENLVSTAQAAPAGTQAFQSTLVPLLKNWRTPLGAFHAQVLGNALDAVDLQTAALVFMQITADALNLATTAEHVDMAFIAVTRISREVDLAQLAGCPEVMLRLAQALERVGRETQGHVRVCEALVEMVGRINTQMAATRSQPTKAKGKSASRAESLAANSNQGVRLTPLHTECLKQCVLARRRELHQRVMRDVVQVRLDAFGDLTAQSRARAFMEYHLYAGMVCVGLDDLELAQQMWHLVFALPARHASMIQVIAYKRLLIVGLAANGQKARLPSFFAGSHARVLDSNMMGYIALADTFANKSMAAAVAKIQDLQAVLEKDENWGLVGRTMHLLPRHFIRRVGSTYSSVRIAQLMAITGFSAHPLARRDDTYGALVQYIQDMRDPSVTVEQEAGVAAKDAVVRFLDAQATMAAPAEGAAQIQNEQQWAALLERKVKQVDELHEHLSKLDRHLALTKEYVSNSRDQTEAA